MGAIDGRASKISGYRPHGPWLLPLGAEAHTRDAIAKLYHSHKRRPHGWRRSLSARRDLTQVNACRGHLAYVSKVRHATLVLDATVRGESFERDSGPATYTGARQTSDA